MLRVKDARAPELLCGAVIQWRVLSRWGSCSDSAAGALGFGLMNALLLRLPLWRVGSRAAVSAGSWRGKGSVWRIAEFLARNGLCVVISAKSWHGRGFVLWIRAREQKFGAVLARRGFRAVDFGCFCPIPGAQAPLCGENPLLEGLFSPHGVRSAPKRPLFLTRPLF